MNFLVLILIVLFSNLSSDAKPTQRQQAQAILKAKCMDCHSNKTVYPWYYNMPGAKQLMDADIQKGRAFLDLEKELFNIKDQKDIDPHVIKELTAVIKSDSMPLIQYRLIHWDKIVTSQDKKILLDWLGSVNKNSSGDEPIEPLPQASELNLDSNKIALGKILFHDKRLSGDNTLSCASCHDLAKGGTDQQQFSTGIRGQKGHINSPTCLNASCNILQFWDGRAKDLEAQAHGPVANPIEMGATWDQVVKKLAKDPQMVTQFKKIYGIKSGNEITPDIVANSIAEFEKSLITSNSRFDQYLNGKKEILSTDEIKGYALFKKYNCTACHYGCAVGGASFQKMGVTRDYFSDRVKGLNGLRKMALSVEDNGRFNVSKDPADKHKFKVPILRNIALTYPYMHDGNVLSLEEAVRIMGEYEVGTKIPKQDIDLIVKFLKTL